MTTHLGFDGGRYSTALAGPSGYFDIFPSWVGEARELKLKNELRPTDIQLETPIGAFFLGDLAKDESHGGARFMTEAKHHLDTKLLMAAAIGRYALHTGEERFTVTTGVPAKLHKQENKRALADLLVGGYEVVLNGRKVSFTVERVDVAVEGPSAYMLLCPGAPGTRRFLDLGSRMINYGTMRNGRWVDKESGSLEFGCDSADVPTDDALARLITAEISLKWRDFSPITYVFGGGIRRCGNYLARYFPRMIWSASPDLVAALTFRALGGGRRGQ